MTQILEPVYITLARTTETSGSALQCNVFDNVKHETKISYSQVIQGFMALVRKTYEMAQEN